MIGSNHNKKLIRRLFAGGVLSVAVFAVACSSQSRESASPTAPATSASQVATASPATAPTAVSDEDARAARVMFELYVDSYENNAGGVQVPALEAALDLRHPGLIVPLVEITRFALEEDQADALGNPLI